MTAKADLIGHYVPTASARLRPSPDVELGAYGGARLFRGKRVLDIGTGDGRLAFGIARWADEVVGIEPDPGPLREARRNARRLRLGNVRFREAAAQALPFADGSFDVVVLSWAL